MGKIRSLLAVLVFASLLVTGCGGGSGSSAPPVQVPETPANVTAAAHDGYVTLSWDAASGAASYNLYWSTASGVTNTNGAKITGVTTRWKHWLKSTSRNCLSAARQPIRG